MKKIYALLLGFGMAVSLTACGGGKDTGNISTPTVNEGETSTKDSMVIVVNGDHGNVNMADSIGNNASMLNSLCTNHLVDFYYDEDGSVQHGICDRSLASSYEYDGDNMGMTFILKEGVLFQNGEELTAEDVIFSLGFYKSKTGYDWIDFENLKAIDDYTVYIPFNYIYSSSLTQLCVVGMWNYDYWEEVGGNETIFFHDAPIGTGAWQITEYETDNYVKLVRFDEYFEGPAILSNLMVRFISESTVAFSELITGGADYVFIPAGSDIDDVESGVYGDEISLYNALKEDALLIGFNGYSKYLQDINVRKAICYAFNRADMTAVYNGAAIDMYTVTSNAPGTMTDYSDKWFYEYNPEAAVECLKEAGWEDTDGDGLVENAAGEEIHLRYLYIGSNANYATIGEIMKNNLAAVGIDLELCGYDIPTYSDMMANDVESWDFWEMQLGSINSANGWNYTYEAVMLEKAHSDQFDTWNDYQDKYIKPLNETLDTEAWWTLFRELEPKTMTDYLYWYPICQPRDVSAYSSKLKGFERITWQTWNLTDCYFTE